MMMKGNGEIMDNIIMVLIILLAVAGAIERLVEVIKPVYLQVKNAITKAGFQECTKSEKIVMSILLGPALCIITQIGIDIPRVNESAIIQYILAGLLASMGSNILHTVLSILLAFKDAAEGIKPKPTNMTVNLQGGEITATEIARVIKDMNEQTNKITGITV
jgi:hypothetical protein